MLFHISKNTDGTYSSRKPTSRFKHLSEAIDFIHGEFPDERHTFLLNDSTRAFITEGAYLMVNPQTEEQLKEGIEFNMALYLFGDNEQYREFKDASCAILCALRNSEILKKPQETLFSDWKSQPHYEIPKKLLWEYDTKSFTPEQWNNIAVTIARRVIEMGKREDWYALFQLYGGLENVAEIVKKIPYLNDRDRNFVKCVFNLKDEDLKCCAKAQ